ncbi:hypothetical protein BKA70DRAFT_1222865 [Coprinopsis sp. MPI-PUGE-AT-0042]|nr:hypothetical protein BKA70DRAFT_1222865 [Coprinopsis sp. MPI-PUGE-AT-0042]
MAAISLGIPNIEISSAYLQIFKEIHNVYNPGWTLTFGDFGCKTRKLPSLLIAPVLFECEIDHRMPERRLQSFTQKNGEVRDLRSTNVGGQGIVGPFHMPNIQSYKNSISVADLISGMLGAKRGGFSWLTFELVDGWVQRTEVGAEDHDGEGDVAVIVPDRVVVRLTILGQHVDSKVLDVVGVLETAGFFEFGGTGRGEAVDETLGEFGSVEGLEVAFEVFAWVICTMLAANPASRPKFEARPRDSLRVLSMNLEEIIKRDFEVQQVGMLSLTNSLDSSQASGWRTLEYAIARSLARMRDVLASRYEALASLITEVVRRELYSKEGKEFLLPLHQGELFEEIHQQQQQTARK